MVDQRPQTLPVAIGVSADPKSPSTAAAVTVAASRPPTNSASDSSTTTAPPSASRPVASAASSPGQLVEDTVAGSKLSGPTLSSARSTTPATVTANAAATNPPSSSNIAAATGATPSPATPSAPALPSPRRALPTETRKDTTATQPNGHKNGAEEHELESELSDPDSNVHSPVRTQLQDEIVVSARANGGRKPLVDRAPSDEDEIMEDTQDEPISSHYPKRKRNLTYSDLGESKIENSITTESEEKSTQLQQLKPKPSRQSLGSVKGVIVGYWRDSPVPDEINKHAVIGFIDVRDRLRTRIQSMTRAGESLVNDYPLPPGPGASWVTFERVAFDQHLVGLDHVQVKEYVRIRSDADDDEVDRKVAEKAAVQEAIRRVKENTNPDLPGAQPAIAYGSELPEHLASANRPDPKRRRTSGGFASINSGATNGSALEQASAQQTTLPPRSASMLLDPLIGTRPTRILLGYWKGSSEPDMKDRHAVYGILGQNDMFRVKVVRETRDGRFVDGNFPTGAGALWIQYEEVEFEQHLQPLTRLEIKEYCRVRQYQLDHGEAPEERAANELVAVNEAQARAGTGYKMVPHSSTPFLAPATPKGPMDPTPPVEAPVNGKVGTNGPELRTTRRPDARVEQRVPRHPLPEGESRSVSRGSPNTPNHTDAMERTVALARREISRAEAAQSRADRHAVNRERTMAAVAAQEAAAAAAAAAAASRPAPVQPNGRPRFHETEELQRLNKVWARQENLRINAAAEDAKIYDGVKYERKATGPFMGKLVSQGTIINIDGEDYVEYRVLTKPSFF
ncbi:hypothetical protein B0I35DRAFT_477519 [Stachybotrys elegans]|uniref:Uncharacterized protein n=1 Tax=Stachybotrys elegans TaxID=80388 RepID=A0A8K0SVL0_9HYPO|nr:hypothetical protein B0I35DRAFT_477519 [Stachybotrys elegans]